MVIESLMENSIVLWLVLVSIIRVPGVPEGLNDGREEGVYN